MQPFPVHRSSPRRRQLGISMTEMVLAGVLFVPIVAFLLEHRMQQQRTEIPALVGHQYASLASAASAFVSTVTPPAQPLSISANALVGQGFLPAELAVNPTQATATYQVDAYGNTPVLYDMPGGGVLVAPAANGAGIQPADEAAILANDCMGVVRMISGTPTLQGAFHGAAYSVALTGIAIPASGVVYGCYES